MPNSMPVDPGASAPPRWPLGTLWARSGHDARSRIVLPETPILVDQEVSHFKPGPPTSAFKCLYSQLQK